MPKVQHLPELLDCGGCPPEEVPLPNRQSRATGGHLAPQLVRMVESELVPRLLLMRRPAAVPAAPRAEAPSIGGPVQELARLLLEHESAVAGTYVEKLRQNGMTTQEIYLHLLPGAARYLGQLWEEDRCGFADVTMAVCSLHQVLHQVAADEMHPLPERQDSAGENSVLLTCMPGEQHTFGVLVVAQFLRRAGWNVRVLFPADAQELIQSVRKKSFSIIGVSIGRYSRADELTLLIRALRRASLNRDVRLIVGGPVIAVRPEIAWQVGADATAIDAQEAANWAQAHWQALPA